MLKTVKNTLKATPTWARIFFACFLFYFIAKTFKN